MPFESDSTYAAMKIGYDGTKSLLIDILIYHWRLKRFIKTASYGQILF
jgi:hypothetical protein